MIRSIKSDPSDFWRAPQNADCSDGCQSCKKQVKPGRFSNGGPRSLSLTIKKAKRISDLPPYLFAEIDRRKRQALSRGVDLIDLGIGDPDIPTPATVVEKLIECA